MLDGALGEIVRKAPGLRERWESVKALAAEAQARLTEIGASAPSPQEKRAILEALDAIRCLRGAGGSR